MLFLQVLTLPFVEVGNAIRWWYGVGLRWMNRWLLQEFRWVGQREHLGEWLRNLFTPMYGDASWQGRVISFFMRLAVLGYRLAWSVVWSVLHAVLWIAYVLLPALAAAMILRRFL